MENTFVPVFLEEKDREDWVNSLVQQYPTFSEWYDELTKSHNTLIGKISWFIYKNWEKVTDWKDYRVELNEKEYGGEIWPICEQFSKTNRAVFKRMNAKIIPIKSIKITYDTADGDVSVECNDDGNWDFLNDEQIISLGLYIENKLNNAICR